MGCLILTHSPHLTEHVCTSSLPASYFSGPSHAHLTHTPHPTPLNTARPSHHHTIHPQQNVCAPKKDPELKVKLYTRSPKQIELLGLDQMNVD